MEQEFINKKLKYIQDNGLSYSRFKNFEFHPSTIFKDKELKYSDAMDIGTVLDLLIQDKKIVISNITPVTGQIGSYIEKLSWKIKEGMLLSDIDSIKLETYNEVGFKQKKFADVELDFMKPENLDYYNYLVQKQNDFVVTQEIYDKALNLYNIFKDFYSNELFDCDCFQLDDVFMYNDLKLRVIIDGYSINHNEKIINVYDFKTSKDFKKSYEKFNYITQVIFYKLYFQNLYPDYNINFYFLTINTEFGNCEKYYVTEKTFQDNLIIFENNLNDLKWHIENNKWDFKKSYYEKNYYEL